MKTHKFDTLSFLAGLGITVIGLIFLIPAESTDVFHVFAEIGAWFWPAVLVAVGIAILAPLVSRYRGEKTGEDD